MLKLDCSRWTDRGTGSASHAIIGLDVKRCVYLPLDTSSHKVDGTPAHSLFTNSYAKTTKDTEVGFILGLEPCFFDAILMCKPLYHFSVRGMSKVEFYEDLSVSPYPIAVSLDR